MRDNGGLWKLELDHWKPGRPLSQLSLSPIYRREKKGANVKENQKNNQSAGRGMACRRERVVRCERDCLPVRIAQKSSVKKIMISRT